MILSARWRERCGKKRIRTSPTFFLSRKFPFYHNLAYMRIVSTSYSGTPSFNDPQAWLERISFYTGLLEKLSLEHEVHSIERINFEGSLDCRGVHYHFINIKGERVIFPRKIHRLIKKLEPEVVLVNGFIFPFQIIQLRLALGHKTRIIVLHRAELPLKGWKRYLHSLADRYVYAYLFASAEFGEQWKKLGIIKDSKKIHEVMQVSSAFHPVEKTLARSTLQFEGEPVFLWVGRLNQNKDPITVVKAFIMFLQTKSKAKLYMIYQDDDMLPEVQKIISVTGVGSSVILVGQIPHDELQNWFSAADFLVSGSHHEGGGVVVSEAMSCGCIPLLTDIPAFRGMTGPGECGFLYEPGDEAGLLNLLIKTTTINRSAERSKALQHFQKELSFEAIGRKISHILEAVTKG